MTYNPRHPKLHNTGISALIESISEAHRNAQAQRTSNTGSHFIPSGNVDENGKPDGTGSIIGSGANGGGIAPWVNDTTPPGIPTGITVTSQASMILVTWDGTLQGGVPDDFDHISVEIDGVEAIKIGAKGTYPSDDSYAPGSVHDVRARAYDNAHDVNGQPKPNASSYSPNIMVTVVGAAATEEVHKAQQTAQEAINKATGAAGVADSANNIANEAKNTANGLSNDVQNAVSTATAAQQTAKEASTNAGKASDSASEALDNAKNAINQSTAANTKADKALNNGAELVRNPAMDPAIGDLDGFGVPMDTGDAPSAPPQPYTHYAALRQRDYFSTWRFPLAKNRVYRFGAWVITDNADRSDLKIGWRYDVTGTHWDACFTVHAKDALTWTWVEGYMKTPDNWNDTPGSMNAWLCVYDFWPKDTGWWITGLTIKDVTEAQGAQLTADGKNRTFASKTEPSHTGLAKGDVWYQVDDNGNTVGMKIWDGNKFNPNLMFADGIFVPGSVGPVSIQNGAITAEKIFASEAILDKILVRKLTADDIDVGSLSAAIIKSYKFVTPDGLNGFDESGFWTKDKEGNILFKTSNGELQAVGGLQTASSGDRIQLSQTLIKGTTVGGLQGIGDDPNAPYWLIWGDHDKNGMASRLFVGTNTQQPEIATIRGNDGKNSVSLTANKVDINGPININGDLSENGTPRYHLTPRMAFKWYSEWAGVPQEGWSYEFNQQFVVQGPGEGRWYRLDMGARVQGPGEYAMQFLANGNSGSYQYTLLSSKTETYSVDNYTFSKTIFFPNGTYTIALNTFPFGAQIQGDVAWTFKDPMISPNPFHRFLTLVEV